MTGRSGRRLPAQAYRLLALAALRHHGVPVSKGELAWDLRANHPTVTRVLRDLVEGGLADVRPRAGGGYLIAATGAGVAFLEMHGGSMGALFAAELEEHFRYGPRPRWLPA